MAALPHGDNGHGTRSDRDTHRCRRERAGAEADREIERLRAEYLTVCSSTSRRRWSAGQRLALLPTTTLPQPGHHARRWLRQPDRLAVAAASSRSGQPACSSTTTSVLSMTSGPSCVASPGGSTHGDGLGGGRACREAETPYAHGCRFDDRAMTKKMGRPKPPPESCTGPIRTSGADHAAVFLGDDDDRRARRHAVLEVGPPGRGSVPGDGIPLAILLALLCLYGLGANAGLKRLAVGRHGFSYKELLHKNRVPFFDAF